MSIHLQRKRAYVYLIVLLSVTLACSTLLPGGSSESPADTPAAPTGVLRCEREGFPCSYAEADPDAVQRGQELLQLADEIYAAEGTMIAAGERLKAEQDVVEIAYDARGLWLRVEGAPPMWLWDYADIRSADSATPLAFSRGGGPLMAPRQEATGPIGPQPPGEEPEKRALLILPWAWDMTDDSQAVADLLRGHRNYRCAECIEPRVFPDELPEQPENADAHHGPSLEWFSDWREYDLIYVFSHGRQWCGVPDEASGGYFVEGRSREPGDCAGFLTTGRHRASILDDIESISTPGMAWGRKPGGSWWIQALTPDFFRSQYGGGLDDSLLFFNSCQLMANDSFSSALSGENTAVIGWSESVRVRRGVPTAATFFERLIASGQRVKPVFEHTTQAPAHATDDTYAGAELRLHGEHDVRGREVVTWMHPMYREELGSIGHTMVHGIAGDGQPDDIFFMLQFDGIDESQDPQDFTAHVKVNGNEAQETFTPEEQIDEDSYWVQGVVPLTSDVSEIEIAELEAWVDLPRGGESRHVLQDVELAGCGWTGQTSGARSGPIEGHEVIYLQNAAEMDPQQFGRVMSEQELAAQMPQIAANLERAGQLPLTIALYSEAEGLAAQVMADGVGLAVFGPTESFVSENMSLSVQRETDTRLEGTISGSMLSPVAEQNLNLDADFIWHVGSRCSFNIKLQVILNAQADGEIQAP